MEATGKWMVVLRVAGHVLEVVDVLHVGMELWVVDDVHP